MTAKPPPNQFGTCYPYNNAFPHLVPSVFLAPGARVIGRVSIKSNASIWYNAVIRGDVNTIDIGAETNIQDGCVLHVDSGKAGFLRIGDRVTVGHMAMLHACVIEDECLIGMQSTVLDGAIIEQRAMVAAGAVVPPGMRLASKTLYAGVPAKPLRALSPKEIERLAQSAANYIRYARSHCKTLQTQLAK